MFPSFCGAMGFTGWLVTLVTWGGLVALAVWGVARLFPDRAATSDRTDNPDPEQTDQPDGVRQGSEAGVRPPAASR